MPAQVMEPRKIRKPLMEKKRRARINDSLETLKQMLLESRTAVKEVPCRKSGGAQRTAKLEKADILEMTVTYIQSLRNHLSRAQGPAVRGGKEQVVIRAADSSSGGCDQGLKVGLTLVPTRLGNGDLAFVIPSPKQPTFDPAHQDNVWRPW